ncbi:MAG TPA: isoprenylcysteine carboxylmethyltransferase family protein [Alloacidobacterium sp.]|jgi:protein-S-isoprenylcysteine O-methyltransferase Ste14|nr:isoprenylcysteine carboxylmethyltransferase family protein [Alloacidobacterium sp.]
MKATQFEFRFRLVIGALFYVLGFWVPWSRYFGSGHVSTTWLELPGALASAHLLSLESATVLLTVVALLCAIKGTIFRIWGTAYLGTAVVHDTSLHGTEVIAAGPYRYTRNPLYMGTFIFSLAVSILMPPTGAILFIAAQAIFYFRLILAEEAHLSAQQGEAYLAYKQKVPRFLRSLRARVPAFPAKPQWLTSILAESYYVSFTVCFAILAWRYNAYLLIKCLIICFGASLVIRAILPQSAKQD